MTLNKYVLCRCRAVLGSHPFLCWYLGMGHGIIPFFSFFIPTTNTFFIWIVLKENEHKTMRFFKTEQTSLWPNWVIWRKCRFSFTELQASDTPFTVDAEELDTRAKRRMKGENRYLDGKTFASASMLSKVVRKTYVCFSIYKLGIKNIYIILL